MRVSFRSDANGRLFELIILDNDAAIVEHGSDDPPMISESEEGLQTWVEFHELFDVLFTTEEMEVLDACEMAY